MLSQLGVFTEAEVVSRHHVRIERYVKNILIEVDTLRSVVDTQILPACYQYHTVLAAGVGAAKAAGAMAPQADTLTRVSTLIGALQSKRTGLEAAMRKAESGSEEEKAKTLATEVSSAMSDVRSVCDELESIVADDQWPLPKYREMLFLS